MKHLTENPNSEAQNNSEARIPNFETNPNIEARIPKQIRNPKSEIRNSKAWARRPRHAIRNPKSGIRNGNIRSYSCNSCSAFRNPKSRIRNAFTMMELMMAIGIFAIGMGLVAGLFPAAVKESENSGDSTQGAIVYAIGMTEVLAKYTLANCPFTTGTLTYGPPTNAYFSSEATKGRLCPIGGSEDTGYLVAGRRINGNHNDFQFLVVSYKRSVSGDTDLFPKTVTIADSGNISVVTFITDDNLQIGSPVIVREDRYSTHDGVNMKTAGEFARIVELDGTVATLDQRLTPNGTGEGQAESNALVYVVYEGNGAVSSPAMEVLSMRTGLRGQ